VPSRLIREVVEARITSTTVEIFHRGTRVGSHASSAMRNRHTAIPEQMPSAPTPRRVDAGSLMQEAEKIGPATLALFEAIMRAKPHPEERFRSCLGILRLAKEYGVDRLEAACRRGNDIGARSYGSIGSIL
jgi:transposase